MIRFAIQLVRPYWRWLLIVIGAMLVDTAMALASPWPLKIVLDSVFDAKPLPAAVAWLVGGTADRLTHLNVAVVATIVIALLQAVSAYLNAYYTVSIGQWIAHDLRQSVYAHLQRLSMSYYDKQQVGPLISTITDDINAVQDFASTSLLDILIDVLTIVGMLAVMFTLNWRFTLVALAVTPLVAVFAIRLRAVVKQATRDVRRRQSEIVSIVQEGLGAIRVVKAFAQGGFERRAAGGEEPGKRRGGALRAARAIAARPGGDGRCRDRHRRRAVVRRAAGARRGDDGRRAGRLHDLSREAVPADPGPRARQHEHRPGLGRPRARHAPCSTRTSACRARRTRAALDPGRRARRVPRRDVRLRPEPSRAEGRLVHRRARSARRRSSVRAAAASRRSSA